MANQSEIKQLRRQTTRFLQERRGLTPRLELAALRDEIRRQSKAARAQERVARAVARKTGLDYSVLELLHKRDNAAAQAMRKQLRSQTAAAAPKQLESHTRRLRRIRAMRKRVEWEKGNPRLLVCQWAATNIDITHFPSAHSTLSGITMNFGATNGVNKIRFSAVSDSRGDLEADTVEIRHEFVWDSDRDGVLSAHAYANLIGAWELFAPGQCHDHSGARVFVDLVLTVMQGTGAAELAGASPDVPVLTREALADCSAKTRSGSLNTGDLELVRPTFPIIAGRPVMVTVSLFAQLQAWKGAEAVLDLNGESSFQYNVPTVWLVVDT